MGAGRSSRRAIVGIALAALAMIVVPLVVSRLVAQPAGAEYRFEIPDGTAARIAAGERVDVLPADLRFQLRDRLVVVNHDHATHHVGPFTIAPGQRLERRLSDAGTFSGFCTLHSDDRIDIRVGA
jgi:xanthine/CO dehydrogenase XdhC/CoxF family maturation factor